MAENQLPIVGGRDVPQQEGLGSLQNLVSKADKGVRSALGPASGPLEGLLSLFDLRNVPQALETAGKDLQRGATEGDPKAILAGVLGTALVGAEGMPGGKAAGKAGKAINDLIIDYPRPKQQWWLDEADETGFVTLYHGADKNELDSILKTGLRPDGGGFAYTSPDASTATAYSVMAGGEKKFKNMGKQAKDVSAENRIVIEFKVPIEEITKNFNKQRSPRSRESLLGLTSKDEVVTAESLATAKKKFTDSPFDPDRGPIKINTEDDLKFKTPYYELNEFRFEGGLSPKYITGVSQKPKVKRDDVAEDKDLNPQDFLPTVKPKKVPPQSKEKEFNLKDTVSKIQSVMQEPTPPIKKEFNVKEIASLIKGAVNKKKGGSIVERNPYNYKPRAI